MDNPRFDSAKLEFSNRRVCVTVYPHLEAEMRALTITVGCWLLERQVSYAIGISESLGQLISAVEHLTLEHEVLHGQSSEGQNEVYRTEWRKLLRLFRNVKTLHIGNELVEELSRCLRLEDGELPLEPLPELQELTYSGNSNIGDAFAPFIDARQNAGHPVTLTNY